MEHLTKAQIVLLTMFVSFVASMATGVVVVTLMQQTPEPVSQTITNVVERTIEKIVPTTIEKPGKTIVVKDEDLVVAAIEKNSKSTVALKYIGVEGERISAGVGTIVSPEGLIIADKGSFNNGLLSASVNGVAYTIEVVASAKDSTLVLGKLVRASSANASSTSEVFTPVTFGNPAAVKVGQTALVLGGRDAKTIASGMVTSLDTSTIVDKDTKEESTVLNGIVLSQRLAGFSNGAPIITLDGNVVGFVSIDETMGSQVGVTAFEARTLITTQEEKKP